MWIDAGRSRMTQDWGKPGGVNRFIDGSEYIHAPLVVPCGLIRGIRDNIFALHQPRGFGRDPVVPLAVPYLAFVGADSRALDDLGLPNFAPVLSRLACQGIKSGQGPSKEKRSPQRLCRLLCPYQRQRDSSPPPPHKLIPTEKAPKELKGISQGGLQQLSIPCHP